MLIDSRQMKGIGKRDSLEKHEIIPRQGKQIVLVKTPGGKDDNC